MAERFGLVVALSLGVVVRAAPIVTAGGVVGDGGLILALVDDLRAAGMSLPANASYNDLGIPFAYPPLALYAAALVGEVTGASTLDILTWMPLVMSVLALGAFAFLARRVLPPLPAVAATFAFALMPSAYGWLVAAGGLTRATGVLFAIVAAALASNRVGGLASYRTAAGTGVLLGLAVLSHPQAAVFGVLACVVLSWRRPAGAWVRRMGVACVTATIIVLPWLAWIVSVHGLEPLVSAGQRAEPLIGMIRLLNLRFTGAPFMDIVAVAGVLGLLAALLRRQWRVPVLLVAISLAGAGGGEFLAAIPWALLAGVGTSAVIDLGRNALEGAEHITRRATAVSITSVVLFLALIGALGSVTDTSSKLHPLDDDLTAAMRWIDANAPAGTAVLVPTSEVWGYDEVSEWLPAVARRRSIGTVQGTEWLPRSVFESQLASHHEIVRCAGATAECYRTIAPDAMLFVPKGRLQGLFSPSDCCPALRDTLTDAGYTIVNDDVGATIAAPPD